MSIVSDPVSAKLFLEFIYPEARDLCKHFLTLNSGILVFSVTFAEKVVSFSSAPAKTKGWLVGAWILYALSFILGGTSVAGLFLSAGQAQSADASWNALMVASGYTLFTACAFFCLGLLATVVAGVLAFYGKKPPTV